MVFWVLPVLFISSFSSMKVYALKFALFLFPFGLLFAFPLLVFILGGEAVPFESLTALSMRDPESIVGLAYSNLDRPFKLAMLQKKNPELLILGTSRVTQISKEFFKPGTSFYNAGTGVQYAEDLPELLRSLGTTSAVRTIVLGVDPHFLNPAERLLFKTRSSEYPITATERIQRFLQTGWKDAYQDYFDGKYVLADLWNMGRDVRRAGLNALVNNAGFAGDGSSARGKVLAPAEQKERLESDIAVRVASIRRTGDAYEFGTELAPEGLSALAEFLELAKAQNIRVIGFLPPYASALQAKVLSLGNRNSAVMEALPREVGALFAKHGFLFYDFSLPASFGSSDDELIDPIHGSPVMYAHIIRELAKHDAYVAEKINREAVTRIAEAR